MRGDASRHDSDDDGGLFGAPHVKFTSSAKLPNKVKVRKKFVLWPLKLKAGFDYDTRKDEFNFVGSCKETILGGRFGLDTGNREVTYRRLFKLGGGNALCLQASCPYEEVEGRKRTPYMGVAFHSDSFQSYGSVQRNTTENGSIDIRAKVPISKRIRAEICGNVKVPMIVPQYSASTRGSQIALHDDDFAVHIAEVNGILYL